MTGSRYLTSCRLQTALLLGLFGLAILLRLWDLSARNLWTDEAWVALAALAPTPHDALVLGQSTPPFYVLAIWGLAHLFGGSEAVLRSLSLVFGVGTVALFWFTARRLTSPVTALLGSFLVAVSPVLVYFSKELKQYSADAFFAVLLVWLAEGTGGQAGSLVWVALALAGSLALGFSHGAVFVLPTILLVLWLSKGRSQRLRVVGLGAFWVLSVAAFYLFFFRGQVSPMLLDYWSGDFPDFSGVLPFLAWFVGALGRYFHYFFHYFFYTSWGWLWGAALTAVGCVGLMPAGAPASFGLLGRPSPSGLGRGRPAPLPLYGPLQRQPPAPFQRALALSHRRHRLDRGLLLALGAAFLVAGPGSGRPYPGDHPAPGPGAGKLTSPGQPPGAPARGRVP